MRLSFVVLNWQQPDLASRAAASVANAWRALPEIIIVENGSGSRRVDCRGIAEVAEVKHIVSGRNLGVARGRNLGARSAKGDLIVMLDDDAEFLGPLDEIVGLFKGEPRLGVVGPRIVDDAGELSYSCRRFPTVLDKLARRSGRFGSRYRAGTEYWSWDHTQTRWVDYVIGACQVIRRDAFRDVGGYDEQMFYGPEDVDLCARMWKQGWKVAYSPAASVRHHERRVTRKPSRLMVAHVRALVRYFRKHGYWIDRSRLYEAIGAVPEETGNPA